MFSKLAILLAIALSFNLSFDVLAKEVKDTKTSGGAAELQNISSPNGLEEITNETRENTPDNEDRYQLQKKTETNEDSIEIRTRNEDSESGEDGAAGVFKIKL